MSNMYTEMLADTLRSEGGVNEREVGGGGVSNRGITQTALDAYNVKHNLPKEDVRDISKKKTISIFNEVYFREPGYDRLPVNIGKQMFDFGVQSSPKRATQFMQRLVGAKDDGRMGDKTIAAINNFISTYGEDALINKYINDRGTFIEGLIRNQSETYGSMQEGLRNRVANQRNTNIVQAPQPSPQPSPQTSALTTPIDPFASDAAAEERRILGLTQQRQRMMGGF